MKANRRLTVSAVILGLALPVIAAGQELALPQPKSEGTITYLSGGIGLDESLAIKQAQKQYPLALTFSEHGEYLSDVQVSIKDRSGRTVLETVSDGPMMLVKLPAGDYRISAQINGKTLERRAQIKAAGTTHLSFDWPRA